MRVFLNEDWLHYLMAREDEEVTEKELKEFIYQYKDTTVTDFLFNVNGTVSSSPSAVLETWVDRYGVKEENGVAVDYTQSWMARAYDLMVRKQLDMYRIWVQTCKEIGMNPWLSIRMNDAHGNMERTDVRRSSQVEKNTKEWISAHRRAVGYFDKCFDYSNESVRARMLSYIKEQAQRYDVYGVELDFSREPYCFPCGKEEEGQGIILAFVRDVRRTLDEIGEHRGKRMALSILGQGNPFSALKTGFDIAEIAKEGLIDLFVASPRWETVNTDAPIELWKKLLPDTVKFGCSQGLLLRGMPSAKAMIGDVATDMGQAAANVHRGCDILYLYNHFDKRVRELDGFSHKNDMYAAGNMRYIYENIGKTDEYERWQRRIPVTYDDFIALSESYAAHLPVRSSMGVFRIPCGRIPSQQTVYIHIALEEALEPERLSVYVNTQKAEFCKDKTDDIVWTEGTLYTFAVDVQTEKVLGIEVMMDTVATICYVDAFIPGR